jgi:hypothetical protein
MIQNSALALEFELRLSTLLRVTRPHHPSCVRISVMQDVEREPERKLLRRLRNGGGGGIRTHESFRSAGFQDRSHQPLDHPSEALNARNVAALPGLSKTKSG